MSSAQCSLKALETVCEFMLRRLGFQRREIQGPMSPAVTLQWRHNGRDGVSNHQPHHCLLNRLFKAQIKETSKLRDNGHCVGKWPITRKMFPYDDVIMFTSLFKFNSHFFCKHPDSNHPVATKVSKSLMARTKSRRDIIQHNSIELFQTKLNGSIIYKRWMHISYHILDFIQQKKTTFIMKQPDVLSILYGQ